MDPNQTGTFGESQSTTERIKEEVSAMAETAKSKLGEIAEPVKDKAVEVAEKQKDAGADQMRIVAGAVHGAAKHLESEMPQIADFIHDAGQRLERAADQLRQGDVNDLMSKLRDYAREQPAMLFGGAMIAGFALTRFLKSAAHRGQANEPQMRSGHSQSGQWQSGQSRYGKPQYGQPGYSPGSSYQGGTA